MTPIAATLSGAGVLPVTERELAGRRRLGHQGSDQDFAR
jgi:hypothetical protein